MQFALSGINTQNQLLTNNLTRHNGLEKSPLHKTGNNDVSIAILTPEKTQALLNREIADKLQERFKDEGIELKGLNADDFTPEKVSDRILSFVSAHVLGESDNEQQNELMAQAREGIEQGFAEAREILESLDVLNGQVKTDIDSTYDLIQKGLDNLEQKINGTEVEDDESDDDAPEASANVQQASIQSSFARNKNTQIEIITTDGDKILIDLFKEQSAQSLQQYSQNEEGLTYSQSRTLAASTGINYQVEGELDEDEQKAIDDLLKDVARVSDQFFSGNVQQAFKKAMEMDFDSEELTRFSLNLSYQETRQTAISTYSNYQAQSQPEVPGQTLEPTGIKDMSDFIKQVDQLFQQPFTTTMADSEQGIGDLLKGMNQLLHAKEMTALVNDSTQLLDSLVHQLKQLHGEQS
ncbi:MAG: DUF5610 domain-containing protein [gamma proteobacterium symbiont of Bathyaustriella thionipta]|nr:DUF5610 domain-containing protein [gamma proteobacterium symbiont of Bathyaustriella thionipta]MCU7949961.1 DUF5610 domain-containing protein [gamma proteobacterium symbiont of Bathyaustriella thionipta]MCU7953616.1 DUF5610 domain-containing protein [gamma proteobacterium symbiont of Bathyaustriella thionipta]MCU7956535.1 DUF5610 domain-containing protein [gamma proteobacterium symbiont of Bathyaustriella thionipta]MCU7968798.1 DUF5610 domain-containing protein [gamma proteobacterium symbion